MSEILKAKNTADVVRMISEAEFEQILIKAKVFKRRYNLEPGSKMAQQTLDQMCPSVDEKMLLLGALSSLYPTDRKLMQFVEKRASSQVPGGMKGKMERQHHVKFIKILQEIAKDLSILLGRSFKLMIENMKSLELAEKREMLSDEKPENFSEFMGTEQTIAEEMSDVREKYNNVKTKNLIAQISRDSQEDERGETQEKPKVAPPEKLGLKTAPSSDAKPESPEKTEEEKAIASQMGM